MCLYWGVEMGYETQNKGRGEWDREKEIFQEKFL